MVLHNERTVAEITEDVILYNTNFILKNNLSAFYQNQIVNAIKLFFKTVEFEKMEIEQIHRPKRAKVSGYLKGNRRKYFIALIEIT